MHGAIILLLCLCMSRSCQHTWIIVPCIQISPMLKKNRIYPKTHDVYTQNSCDVCIQRVVLCGYAPMQKKKWMHKWNCFEGRLHSKCVKLCVEWMNNFFVNFHPHFLEHKSYWSLYWMLWCMGWPFCLNIVGSQPVSQLRRVPIRKIWTIFDVIVRLGCLHYLVCIYNQFNTLFFNSSRRMDLNDLGILFQVSTSCCP